MEPTIPRHRTLFALLCRMPEKRKPKPRRKPDDINLAELKREDFAPVSKETIGKGLAKLAKAPKAGK